LYQTKQDFYEALSRWGICFETLEHPPVYTIEDMDAQGITRRGGVAKNLFLRDGGGKRHFLVLLGKEKRADLPRLRDVIGCSRLSFASEERLARYLGVKPGAVSPLGVLNDAQAAVEVYIDEDFRGEARFGCHPNDNTATVFLDFEDLLRLLKAHGNRVSLIKIPQ
jgi:Ala-tRNA(Pro) deacylase